VVITQLQPISVIFTIPEDNLPEVLAKFNAAQPLTVDAMDRSGSRKLASGTLEWVDNLIDPATGTVRLRAKFSNEKNELFAGQFVNVSLLLEVKRGTTIAPAAAIQRGPKGTFVYVVNAENVASVKNVKVGPTEGDNASFEEGLSPGDLVVVEGADRLREGSKVELPSAEEGTGARAKKPTSGEGQRAPPDKASKPPSGESSPKPGAGY